jgi:hypothetical protein
MNTTKVTATEPVLKNLGRLIPDLEALYKDMIGAVPPAAINDWRYAVVSLLAGIISFCWFSGIDRLRNSVLVFDAAGLALFAVSGTQKALDFGLNPVMAALLGMLTGIGGGMARDALIAEIPTVLRADLYAIAALLGAAAVVIGEFLHLPRPRRRSSGQRCVSAFASWRSTAPGISPLPVPNAIQVPRVALTSNMVSVRRLRTCCGDKAMCKICQSRVAIQQKQ